jgi:hypothetical protein
MITCSLYDSVLVLPLLPPLLRFLRDPFRIAGEFAIDYSQKLFFIIFAFSFRCHHHKATNMRVIKNCRHVQTFNFGNLSTLLSRFEFGFCVMCL